MKTVLVVDDEFGVREVLTDILEDENFKVLTAKDGSNLDKIVKDECVDCILMDVNLPTKNGDLVTKELKTKVETKSLPVILMSASTSLVEKAKECMADAFISKPFKNDVLINTVLAYCKS